MVKANPLLSATKKEFVRSVTFVIDVEYLVENNKLVKCSSCGNPFTKDIRDYSESVKVLNDRGLIVK